MASIESSHTVNLYEIHSGNYKQPIPNYLVNVVLHKNLHTSLYKKIFRRGIFSDKLRQEEEATLNVTLPDSIQEIPEKAFFYTEPNENDTGKPTGCDMIKSIIIPPNVIKIGAGAFMHCRSLQSIKLPEKLQEIDDGAFEGCTNITEVVMPNSIRDLGKFAFCGCAALQSVTLSDSLQSISEGAFSQCIGLQAIIIPEGVKTIEKGAFYYCEELQSVILPESLRHIEGAAFFGCYYLISINIPNELATIDETAFSICESLQNILIPKNCLLAHDAFLDCTPITKKVVEEGPNWIKTRFDKLPLHQLCHKHDISVSQLAQIPINDPFLHSLDAMGLTPLHILSCNPCATLPMIRELASKCPTAALVKNYYGMFAIDMYLVTRNMVTYRLKSDEEDDEVDGEMTFDEHDDLISLLLKEVVDCSYIHEIIESSSLRFDLMDALFAFKGKARDLELSILDRRSGLYPFMTAATSQSQSLDYVYQMAMLNVSIMEKYEVELGMGSKKRVRDEDSV